MEIDANQLLVNCIKDGIREGIKQRMNQSYQNPFDAMLNEAIGQCRPGVVQLVGDAVREALKDADFTESIRLAVRSELAKILVKRFGGELEKTVNELKSNPATRARITLAIEEIVSPKKP